MLQIILQTNQEAWTTLEQYVYSLPLYGYMQIVAIIVLPILKHAHCSTSIVLFLMPIVV